jgi:hypothetical protein
MNTGLVERVPKPVFMDSGPAHGPSRHDNLALGMTSISASVFVVGTG